MRLIPLVQIPGEVFMSIGSLLKRYSFKKRHIFYGIGAVIIVIVLSHQISFERYDTAPDKDTPEHNGIFSYKVPLDSTSPWPKFRGNELQNGRSPVMPRIDAKAKPWAFQTGKGVFSSPVVDKDGTVYVGSADHIFYAIKKDGSLKWKVETGEIIDSSALLDDRGHVYVGSGDQHVYCIDRESGKVMWIFKAHSVEEVQKEFGVKNFNVAWFEGNIAMLKDGTLLAPNDNYLVYAISRDDGKRKTQYIGSEMVWSLPAVNTATDSIFFGTQHPTNKNIHKFNTVTGKKDWVNGTILSSNASSVMLSSSKENGILVLGGFDGFVRAYSQKSGREIWKFGTKEHIYASPAQLSDGTVIIPSADGSIYALDSATGKQKWAFDTLKPIRSSPVIDGKDTIYVGSGEGRLFCINPDGTLRWAYRCITDDRSDLNASPALGHDGVYIAGESGEIFYVPYDYPLSDAGKKDPLCKLGPKGDLPENGTYMIFTTRFGALLLDTPKTIDANEPVTLSLFVRTNGDTDLSAIDKESLKVSVTGSPKMSVNVAANRRFITLCPLESWTGAEGGTITIRVKGSYIKDMHRFGLKFFGGTKGGVIDQSYTFNVPSHKSSVLPYRVPSKAGDPSTVFEFSRLAAPNPTILPSWNQIGFDSLHYLAGSIEGKGSRVTIWVVGGKLENGATVVDPALEVRYPLTLDYDGGNLTFFNYDGFKINFVGSWDMPFGLYRLSAKADPVSGNVLNRPAFYAVANCDDIEFYGKGLKLMGLSDWDTGKMPVFGGMNLRTWGKGAAAAPSGTGTASFSGNETSASVEIKGGTLKKGEHVYSLMLISEETGSVFPLYYTKKTSVETDSSGIVTKVNVSFDKGQVKGKVRAYYVVDTYPAAKGLIGM